MTHARTSTLASILTLSLYAGCIGSIREPSVDELASEIDALQLRSPEDCAAYAELCALALSVCDGELTSQEQNQCSRITRECDRNLARYCSDVGDAGASTENDAGTGQDASTTDPAPDASTADATTEGPAPSEPDAGGTTSPSSCNDGTCDDTYGCLDSYGGPLITVSGTITTSTTSDSGYRPSSSELADNSRYDARAATFRLGPPGDSQAEGVAYNLTDASTDGDSLCIAGGVYQGIYNRDISWAQGHHGDGQLAYITAPDTMLDGLRADNIAQDSPPIKGNAHNFRITNSWFSYVRDDCIENDSRLSGRIDDNLYDGCYTFLSHQAENSRDGSGDRVVVADNAIHMQNMPKPYDYERYGNDPNSMGYGTLFKNAVGSTKPTVDFVRNVVLMEENLTPRESLAYEKFEVELGECRDNILIWTGPGDWPDPTWEALPAGCITLVLRGQEGLALWEAIRQNWIDCHSSVGRVDGDPASDATRCRTDAYGGGQGGTALP